MPVVAINKGAKQRLGTIINFAKKVFHIGFIPAVIYFGKRFTSVQFPLIGTND